MARVRQEMVESNFSLGLVTETTQLKFPPNSCTEIDNCVLDNIGTISRRYGIDVELFPANNTSTSTHTSNQVYSEFLWTSVGGDGDKSFVVLQVGGTLHFYDVSNVAFYVGGLKKPFTVDLTSLIPTDSTLDAKTHLCSFSNGRGRLVVVSRAINPHLISYNSTTDTISLSPFDVKYRDFEGLPSNYLFDQRPTAATTTVEREHLYNLYNQGWDPNDSDALNQWETARVDLPSSVDTVGAYRASETDSFDPTRVGTTKTRGNTLAPKGHFILAVGKDNRDEASGIDFGGGNALGSGVGNTMFQPFNVYAPSGSSSTTSALFANLQNGVTGVAAVTQSSSFASGNPGFMNCQVTKHFPLGQNLRSIICYFAFGWSGTISSGVTLGIKIYGKNTSPLGFPPYSNQYGTLLGEYKPSAFPGTTSQYGISIILNDFYTKYQYFTIVYTMTALSFPSTASSLTLSQNEYLFSVPVLASTNRPEITTFFAGRSWFSGASYGEKGTYVYFSQVIERPDQFGSCYQKNDPTSELFFDLLADDGGSISIPDAANIQALFPMRSALVVLATNGTWIIRGSSNEGFSATGFRVEKVSSIGCVSRTSVTDVKGIPYWWSEEGVCTLQYDPNYYSFNQITVTDERIRQYYLDIPEDCRRYAKGCYDVSEQSLRFIFNNDPSLLVFDNYSYNKELVYDLQNKSWVVNTYPLDLSDTGIKIRGVIHVFDANHRYKSLTKYITSYRTTDTYMYFSELNQTNYTDWFNLSTQWGGVTTYRRDFVSYFVTGPKIDGMGMKFNQLNYVTVFTNSLNDSSCKMNARFDWSNSGNSGKWSTVQEVYGPQSNLNVNFRRLKVRGKGKSVQLKFVSVQGKPFEIIGWAVAGTGNGAI